MRVPTDEQGLIDAMFSCWWELQQKHRWREAAYAPRDGRLIEVIEAGSTGIHRATRDDEGSFWTHDAHDTYPSNPILFREIAQ